MQTKKEFHHVNISPNGSDYGEQIFYVTEVLRDLYGINETWQDENLFRHFLVMDVLKKVYEAGRNDEKQEREIEEAGKSMFEYKASEVVKARPLSSLEAIRKRVQEEQNQTKDF